MAWQWLGLLKVRVAASYWSSDSPCWWLRVATSPTEVDAAARVLTSMCCCSDCAWLLSECASELVEFASCELAAAEPPMLTKPRSMPAPPPPLTDDELNEELALLVSSTSRLLMPYAMPAA